MASEDAINAIERQGGKITCVYFNKVGMRLHLFPERFSPPIPRFARPPDKLLEFYADPVNRGFLADEEEREKLRVANKERMEAIRNNLQKLKM